MTLTSLTGAFAVSMLGGFVGDGFSENKGVPKDEVGRKVWVFLWGRGRAAFACGCCFGGRGWGCELFSADFR